MCFDFLYNFCLKPSHSEKNSQRDNIIPYLGLHEKYPLFLSRFN